MSSINTAWDFSREHWWIYFICRELNWVSMSKMPSPPLQMESWVDWEVIVLLPFQRISSVLSIYLLICFGIVYIWPMYHSLDKRIWFTMIFLSLKESHSVLDMNFLSLYLQLQPFHLSWLISSILILKIHSF